VRSKLKASAFKIKTEVRLKLKASAFKIKTEVRSKLKASAFKIKTEVRLKLNSIKNIFPSNYKLIMIYQPDPNKEIFFLKDNDVEYEINFINRKLYEHKTNLYTLGFMIICIVCLIIFVLYDWIKDTIRWFSGVKDIYNNNTNGILKIFGWTKGNFMRSIIIFILIALIIISGLFLKSTKQLKYIPDILNTEWDKFRQNTVYERLSYINFFQLD